MHNHLKKYKKIDQFGTVASIDKSGKALIMLPLGRMYFAVSDMYEKKSDAPKQETRKDYYSCYTRESHCFLFFRWD